MSMWHITHGVTACLAKTQCSIYLSLCSQHLTYACCHSDIPSRAWGTHLHRHLAKSDIRGHSAQMAHDTVQSMIPETLVPMSGAVTTPNTAQGTETLQIIGTIETGAMAVTLMSSPLDHTTGSIHLTQIMLDVVLSNCHYQAPIMSRQVYTACQYSQCHRQHLHQYAIVVSMYARI